MTYDTLQERFPDMNSVDFLEPLSRRRSWLKMLTDQIGALGRKREELQRAIADYKKLSTPE